MRTLLAMGMVLMGMGTAAWAAPEAVSWSKMAPGQSYLLRQKVAFEEGFVFTEGHAFVLREIVPLSGLPVVLLEMQAEECPFPEARAEMVLVKPEPAGQPAGHDDSVSLVLEPECRLQVYMDTVDYPGVSLFRE